MNRQNRNRLTDTENRRMVCQRGAVCKGEGTEKCSLAVTEQSQGWEGSAGNTVSDIVITVCVVLGALELSGDPHKV